ncbi:MAG: VanW family protein [Bacteroidales bacterium]|nr:VanW family protein [Clostridium sp.]MCM1203569.1 VanW family protein [Bacteroidales bacterium]
MKKMRALKIVFMVLAAGIAFTAISRMAFAKSDKDIIYAGVYLDEVYVGGLTKEEAMEEYDKYIDGIENLDMTFTTSVGSYSLQLKDIDVSVSVEEAVDKAYHYGRQGNILTRYKEIRALEEENVVLVPEKKFNKTRLKSKLENDTAEIVSEPEDASITRENGEFIVHEGKMGTSIKVDDTIKEVEKIFEEEWKQKDIKLAAAVEEREPQYTTEDFYKVDSVMGHAETGYSGSGNRSNNLITGTNKINGTVLMPGEQFSFNQVVGPRTEENGFQSAGQYVGDELVDGMGGGICQVSTTLYNAVLKSELTVNERSPHSYTVSYVALSKDAAIAGDYMDLKFTNNTEYPIYIAGYAGGGVVTFDIYGHDTRPDNRTIEFVSKTIETIEPGEPEQTEDPTLPAGTTVTDQSAHTGYYAELWKNIYIDGVLTDTVRVNQSQYRASAAKIRIGTMPVAPEQPVEQPTDPAAPVEPTNPGENPGEGGEEGGNPPTEGGEG